MYTPSPGRPAGVYFLVLLVMLLSTGATGGGIALLADTSGSVIDDLLVRGGGDHRVRVAPARHALLSETGGPRVCAQGDTYLCRESVVTRILKSIEVSVLPLCFNALFLVYYKFSISVTRISRKEAM
jgi:hypothetical protein